MKSTKTWLFIAAIILIFVCATHIHCEEVNEYQRIEMRLNDTLIAVGGCINELDIKVVEINTTTSQKKHKRIEITFRDHYIAIIRCIDELDIKVIKGTDYSDWTELKPLLEDGTIGENWWNYSEPDRRLIAETAIKNTLFYYISNGRSGEPNCVGGGGDFSQIACTQNAMIRYLKFGSDTPLGGDACYYEDQDGEESCYVPDIKYNLPCCYARCTTHGAGYGHTMCAIQVNENIEDINSWIFFQYSSFDIKPESAHMPTHLHIGDMYVSVSIIKRIFSCGSCEPNEIMRWEF